MSGARRSPVALVAVGLALVPFWAWRTGPAATGAARAPATHRSVFFDEGVWARAYGRASADPAQPHPGLRAMILPHHWLAGSLIVGGFRDLAASGEWRRLILIGPNHSGAGGAAVSTSAWAWTTPFGRVEPDAESVRGLVGAGLAELKPDVLTYEHSISGLVPPIARFLPGARVVPLALRARLSASEVGRLVGALAGLMDERTVVVASVDFSHYLSAAEARARNGDSVTALRAMDDARVLSYGNDHMDSPPTIAAVIRLARSLGATRFELLADTDSSRFGGSTRPPVTSYVVGLYR